MNWNKLTILTCTYTLSPGLTVLWMEPIGVLTRGLLVGVARGGGSTTKEMSMNNIGVKVQINERINLKLQTKKQAVTNTSNKR